MILIRDPLDSLSIFSGYIRTRPFCKNIRPRIYIPFSQMFTWATMTITGLMDIHIDQYFAILFAHRIDLGLIV